MSRTSVPSLYDSADRRSRTRTTEKQDISVGILEFEPTQSIVLEGSSELDMARQKFVRIPAIVIAQSGHRDRRFWAS